jgi:hypothetical protein
MFKLYNILAKQFLGKLPRGQIADSLSGLATINEWERMSESLESGFSELKIGGC